MLLILSHSTDSCYHFRFYAPYFRGNINEPFRLENAQNFSYKKMYVSNFLHFQDEITRLFFLQNKTLRSESVI